MNKTQKIAIAAVACIILVTAIVGAAYLGGLVKHLELGESNEDSQIYQGYPRTIEDSGGRNVTIYKPMDRIITLTSDGAEGVRTLGAVDSIVGVTDTINKDGKEYFPELADKPSVGTWKEFDYEEIVNLAMNNTDGTVPGVLVISYVSKVSEVEERLSPFDNIAVVGLDLYKEETLDEEIVKLGYLLEREEAAQGFVAWRQDKVATVKSAVDGLEKPKVYIEKGSSTGTGELGTYGKGSAFNLFCEIAGGDNVASHFDTTYPKVDWEWVIDQNPDIIIKEEPRTFLEVTSKAEEMRDEVRNRPSAENMSAIKNDRVYILNRKMDYGLENVVGLTYWAKIFHPDTGLDPEAVYREYLEEYQGLKYPEGNVVVYPKS